VVAPLANLLAAPAIPLTTIVGAISVALVGAFSALAAPVGVLLMAPTGYLVTTFEWTAALPGAIAPVGEVHPAISVVYGAALLVWAAAPTPEGKSLVQLMRSSRVTRSLVAGTGVLCAAAIAALAGLGAARPPLVVTILDVGHGEAVLARTPSGRTLLIDGGPNPSALLAQIGRRMGMFERSLAIAVLTRADSDHLPGMTAAIERYAPELLIGPPEGSPSALYQRWATAGSDGRAISPEAPLTIALDHDIAVELIPTPPLGPLNETGPPQRTLVLRIVYGDTSVLVGPSLTADGGRGLLREGWPLRSDAMLVRAMGRPPASTRG
jgi:competence protein ComEC